MAQSWLSELMLLSSEALGMFQLFEKENEKTKRGKLEFFWKVDHNSLIKKCI